MLYFNPLFFICSDNVEYVLRNLIDLIMDGAVISHTAGGCIDHAHLHAIPLDKDN